MTVGRPSTPGNGHRGDQEGVRLIRFLARLLGWALVVMACSVAAVAVAVFLAGGALLDWGKA